MAPPIDLDANATTPLAPEVLEAMAPHWRAGGNPESRHALGRAARRAWDDARGRVARVLGAQPHEVVFTSGGTEANNAAIFGLARHDGTDPTPAHAIASPIEHPAVSESLEALERQGWTICRPEVAPNGVMDAAATAAALRDDTRLVTLMLANNETGAIQPVAELAALAASRGVPVHTDAAQAIGRIPVNFHALGVATLAASAHKMHGPAGIGVLLVRSGVRLAPWLYGGSQQGGLRPGTPPVALAVGMATALELWQSRADRLTARWHRQRDRLEALLREGLGANRVVRNGPAEEHQRLPQTLNVGFPGADGNALLIQLDLAGVCVSLGAACASGTTQPSPTLLAMRVAPECLRASIRISLHADTTDDEIETAARAIVRIVRDSAMPHEPPLPITRSPGTT